MSIGKKHLLCVLALVLVFSLSSQLRAETQRSGLSFGVGAWGRFTDIGWGGLYPEFQTVADVAFMRMGVSVGLVYDTGWLFNSSGGREVYWFHLPIQADFSLMPFRFFAPQKFFQIYVGGFVGLYQGLGDESEDSYFCVGPKFGIELYMGDWAVLDLEGRYVSIPDHNSYYSVLIIIRYRIPFARQL